MNITYGEGAETTECTDAHSDEGTDVRGQRLDQSIIFLSLLLTLLLTIT